MEIFNFQYQRLLDKFKDYLFPVHCLGCDTEGEWLCAECLKTIDIKGIFRCPICNCITFTGQCCGRCLHHSKLFSAIAITDYGEDMLIGKLIKAIKYAGAYEVVVAIEKLIESFLKINSNYFSQIQTIVPVPLHPRRCAERGFNQAELIAKVLANKLNKPLINGLTRVRYTPRQVGLSREQRQSNLKEAFTIQESVVGPVLLVDDVYTTGSTMQECAKVLRKNGVKEVSGFAIARG